MKLALVQISLGEELTANAEKMVTKFREAAAMGADMVCFPEICFSPFFPQFPGQDVSRYVMPIDHEIIKRLQRAAADSGVVALPNFYLEEGGHRYDATPVIDADGTIRGISKMVHVVQAETFYEQDYYNPSDTGFQVYDTRAGKVGVVICFDRHYPESIRACTLKGAELIVIPTANTKDEPLELFEWELRIPAIQNGVFIAMCNRVGQEHAMDFCGESLVVGPDGNVIAKVDDTEQILIADIDYAQIAVEREKRPYLQLRRPDAYS